MKRISERGEARLKHPWYRILTLGLLVCVGINLRTVLLAVPPILPLLKSDLHLSYTQTGLLSSLPTLVMGVTSLPIGLLIGKMPACSMVAFGLGLLAVGAFLRTLWPVIGTLYFFTALLSLGITCSQTAIPTLVRQWFPSRIGFVTALYSFGMVGGETLGAVFTLPLIPLMGQAGWAGSFLFWSIPVLIMLLLWLIFAPSNTAQTKQLPGKPTQASQGAQRPKILNAWTLGLLVGSAQLIYFSTNAWVASYNQAIGASAFTSLTLGALNAAQLPATLLALFVADRLAGRRSPFILAGILCLVAFGCWVWTPEYLQPLWAAIIGGTTILVYTFGIALPALLVSQEEVAQWIGTMMTVGYLFSFVGPLIGGWLWDLLHIPALVFLPLALSSGLLLILGILLPPLRSALTKNG